MIAAIIRFIVFKAKAFKKFYNNTRNKIRIKVIIIIILYREDEHVITISFLCLLEKCFALMKKNSTSVVFWDYLQFVLLRKKSRSSYHFIHVFTTTTTIKKILFCKTK